LVGWLVGWLFWWWWCRMNCGMYYIPDISWCSPGLQTFITRTRGPTLMELFTAKENWKRFRDVRCVHHGWHGTHQYNIQVLATHVSTWLRWYSSLLVAEMWNTTKNNVLGKKFLICSFCLYRFRKYMSYAFPIINFCNPEVHYEMPCACIFCCPFTGHQK
jgi:hypothetical protein